MKLIYFRKNNKQRKRKIDDILRGYFGGRIPLDGSSDEGDSSDSDAEADDECGMLIFIKCKILSVCVLHLPHLLDGTISNSYIILKFFVL